jgi:hypothetical protein
LSCVKALIVVPLLVNEFDQIGKVFAEAVGELESANATLQKQD